MSTANQLIGKFYPVKDVENNEIVGFRTILKAEMVENIAGYAIYLTNSETPHIISVALASKMINDRLYQCLDNVGESK